MTTEGTGLQITRLRVGALQANCYLLTDPASQESIVVDPGADVGKIMAAAAGSRVTLIVVTHRHGDHTDAVAQARAATGALVAAHPLDAPGIPGGIEVALADGDTLTCGQHSLRVLHTPGHTPGSLCFFTGHDLIAGDTLFPGGPGSTAGPDTFAQIVASICDKIYLLPDETVIHPGHGSGTTVAISKAEYAVFASKPQVGLSWCDVRWLAG